MFIISSCNVLNLDGSKPVFEVIDNDANNAESIPINSWLTQLGQVTTAPGGSNTGVDKCSGVSTDSSGNVYCAGTTTGAMREANAGGEDAFVMKLDTNGNLVWLTQLGQVTRTQTGNNVGTDECHGVSTDSDGNVYCAGSTKGSMGEANAGGKDAFVMKLDTNGNLVWLTQLGQVTRTQTGNNVGNDECHGVSTDSDGNVYCAGTTTGAMGEANAGLGDAFVMKLDTNGSLVWLTQLGELTVAPGGGFNNSQDRCTSVSSDLSGNVYCAGFTYGAMGEANAGSEDAFVMKLDTNGNLVWLTQLGQATRTQTGNNAGNDIFSGIDVDSSGYVYCSGTTTGSMGEDNGGSNDAIIAKLDQNGSLVWLTQLGQVTTAPGGSNTGGDKCSGVSTDSDGNVYCAGFTEGSIGEANAGEKDAFVMKLDNSGDLKWLTHFGDVTTAPDGSNTSNDQCYGISVDSSGNVYCGGETDRMGEINGSPSSPTPDAFILKLEPDGIFNP